MKNMGNKTKNKWVEQHETEKFLHAKMKKKHNFGMGGSIYKPYIW